MKEKTLGKISNIRKKEDGSYIVDYEGLPYHIIATMTEEYEAVKEFVKQNPNACTDYIEPVIEPTLEEKVEIERYKRNQLLNEVDTLLLKYTEQVELGIVSENKNYYTALLQYKQALRDIPEQAGFPEEVKYPTLPKYENY